MLVSGHCFTAVILIPNTLAALAIAAIFF